METRDLEVAEGKEVVNLYDETTEKMKEHGFSWRNIKFVVNREGIIPIAEFASQAKNIFYDKASGDIQIDPYLRVVGKFWWLERMDHDGREGWVFFARPRKPTLEAKEYSLQNVAHDSINWTEKLK